MIPLHPSRVSCYSWLAITIPCHESLSIIGNWYLPISSVNNITAQCNVFWQPLSTRIKIGCAWPLKPVPSTANQNNYYQRFRSTWKDHQPLLTSVDYKETGSSGVNWPLLLSVNHHNLWPLQAIVDNSWLLVTSNHYQPLPTLVEHCQLLFANWIDRLLPISKHS